MTWESLVGQFDRYKLSLVAVVASRVYSIFKSAVEELVGHCCGLGLVNTYIGM